MHLNGSLMPQLRAERALACPAVYALTMGMVAATLRNAGPRSERPVAVTVFISCLGAFALANAAAYYPRELLPYALMTAPLLALFFGAIALGIWNRSTGAWVVNVWIWAGLLWRALTTLLGEPADSMATSDFTLNLGRVAMAAVLLNILLSPTLFRWMWHKDRRVQAS